MSRAENESGGVQVIQRAAQILDALKDNPDGMSLSQIAERTGLARSTVHRLVSAMTTHGLLASVSPNGRFRPGPAIAALAAAAERSFVAEFHPTMAKLARSVNETVDLAVLEHDHVRFVHQITASHRLRAVSSVGAVFPAHCTANGKALLAQLPESEVIRLLPERLDQFTANTITDRDRLLEELEEIRRAKVAYDREEHTLGICAAGTALLDADGAVAMTVPMPAQRFYGNEEALAKALLAARRGFERARPTPSTANGPGPKREKARDGRPPVRRAAKTRSG